MSSRVETTGEWTGHPDHHAVCDPCGYRSKPFDKRCQAQAAITNHRTTTRHRLAVARRADP